MSLTPRADSGARTHGAECFSAAWTAGLLAAFAFYDNGVFPAIITLVCLALTAVFAALRCTAKQILVSLLGVLLACTSWTIYNGMVRQPLLALDGDSVICSAKITDLRYYSMNTIRYTLRMNVDGIHTEADWYAGEEIPRFQIGDELTMNATFSCISDDFRYHSAQYAAGQGKYLRVAKVEDIIITKQNGFSIKRSLRKYRENITARIRAALSSDEAGLLLAMLFGDKNCLSDESSAALYQTGIGHVTAVSGLHLVFFCTLLTALLRRLRCSARVRFVSVILASALFSIMVDSAVSVYRAALMLLLAQSAELFGRRADTLRSLCIAVLCCTVFTPYVIGSASFWLSVSGVLGVGVIAPWMTRIIRLPRKNSKIYPLASVGKKLLGLLCVSVAVFPASVILCGESSLLSPIGNLVILPFAIIALYLGLVFACTGGVLTFLLPAAGFFSRLATTLAKMLAKLPYSHIQIGAEPIKITLFCCAVFVLLTACITRHRLTTAFSVVLCGMILSIQLAFEQYIANNQLRIAIVGKEKYSAAIIMVDGHTAVLDDSTRSVSASYVHIYLENNAVSSFDTLFCRSQTIAAYHMAFTDIGSIYMPDSTYLRNNQSICGSVPISCGTNLPIFQTSRAECSISDGILHINWMGQAFELPKSDYINQILTIDADMKYHVSAIK